jgi:hypothetical protein
MLFGEGYRRSSRTSKFPENLVVGSRVESNRDISAPFIVVEEDVPQKDPTGIRAHGWLFDEVLGLLYRSRDGDDLFGDASTFSC